MEDNMAEKILEEVERSTNSGVDYVQLQENVEFIQGVTEAVLGFAVVLLLVGLPLIIAIEIMYINLNPVNIVFDRLKVEGPGPVKKMLSLALMDAVKAVEKSRVFGEDANKIYLGLKLKTIILVAIMISLIAVGSTPIINIVGNIAKGIMESIMY